ncbi:MAG: TetR/AcrR family transcriptional regulator [Actinobacteria bacterium]|nr:TetR/AcrR family transcriptional regulator [Actinomycetota bacterium]
MSVRTPVAEPPPEESSSPHVYSRLKPGRSQSQFDVIASQRFRLQRAMIELTARDGFDAVTVRKLTKSAGVSSRAFYLRFSGVDDCLLKAYAETMGGAADRIRAARSPELEPADQVGPALRALLGGLLEDRDVARFALIEVYAGGPAALAAITAEERRVESALRGCLDRRSRRIPKAIAAALVAAALRCARVQLIDAAPAEAARTIDLLVEWARDLIEGNEDLGVPAVAIAAGSSAAEAWGHERRGPRGRDDEDLLLAAVLRLALPQGFHGLTSSKVSSAAGLPTARFRRHFADLADGYLAAISRTCRSFFVELTAGEGPGATGQASIRLALRRASRRATSDPPAARLTFRQVVDAGVAGLTCRESLISELALACSASTPPAARPRPIRAEASIAALWATLAMISA